MIIRRLISLVRQHMVAARDLSILVPALLVATFICYEFDIFENEGSVTEHVQVIETDEVLLLAGLLAVGLLIFLWRRNLELRRETQRRLDAEQTSRALAFQDVLTGLPNRRQFDEALRAAVAAPPRTGGVHAIFILDLNGFKQVNDTLGHGAGDAVLIAVGQKLQAAVPGGHLVARLGGDEFGVIALHLPGPEAAARIAAHVLQAFEQPVVLGQTRHRLGAGIGISLLPANAATASEAMRMADVALYRAKAERRSTVRFFEESMDRILREREQMEEALQEAIATKVIRPYFRPSVDLRTRQIVSFDAIPRWVHPTLGEIPPERFIPIADDAGLAHELFEQFVREACVAVAAWPSTVSVGVGMFPSQLHNETVGERILTILGQSGIEPGRLEIQITESALVSDLEAAQRILGGLRQAGVKIALDNFGTGYSSLYHLRSFKLDKIKIDRRFIDTLGLDDGAETLAALVGLGHGLGLTVTADGVDETEQRFSLLGAGCQQGQGRLFSELLSEADVSELLFQGDRRTG